MQCGTEENTADKEWQDLSGWQGMPLKELIAKLHDHVGENLRVYTVASTSLENNSNKIFHKGSGPNLEGGLATLCTCKHSMRQNHSCEDWLGKWVLGLTSRAKNKGFRGQHYLLYMMKIEHAFISHAELFNFLATQDKKALRTKNAMRNRLGDIFEPRADCLDPFDPVMYKQPHKNHSHTDSQWHDDIIYKEKPVPMLLGSRQHTFVWPQPEIRFRLNRGTGNMKLTIGEPLFSLLESI